MRFATSLLNLFGLHYLTIRTNILIGGPIRRVARQKRDHVGNLEGGPSRPNNAAPIECRLVSQRIRSVGVKPGAMDKGAPFDTVSMRA